LGKEEDRAMALVDGRLEVSRGGNNAGDAGPPEVSIIVLNWNRSALTLNCLSSVRRYTRSIGVELIVVDNGSNPLELAALKNGMDPDVHLISLAQNMFFGEGNNIAAEAARGNFLLFLNNDATIASDVANDLVVQFAKCFSAGAIGPRLNFPNGAIQEAGAFLLPNGISLRYGQSGLNVDPHFESGNHVVDYCSAACLLVERQTFIKVGGFDPLFDPAYYEDCDLCLRLRSMGLYTYYASEIEVFHEANATSSELWGHEGISQIVAKNHRKFLDRWRYYLEGRIAHPVMPKDPLPAAKSRIPTSESCGEVLLQSPAILQVSPDCSVLFRVAAALQHKYIVTLAPPEACSSLRVRSLCRHFGVQLSNLKLTRGSQLKTATYDYVFSFSDRYSAGGDSLRETLKSIYKLL
jgi:GT2 family glycosyltransferase